MTKLTLEAKDEIRKHIWIVLVPPAIVLAALSFSLGFAINEVARSQAYKKALENVIKPISESLADARNAKDLTKDLDEQVKKANTELELLKKTKDDLSNQLAQINGSIERNAKIIQLRMDELTKLKQTTETIKKRFINLEAPKVLEKIDAINKMSSRLQNTGSTFTDITTRIDTISESVKELERSKLTRCRIEQQSNWLESCSAGSTSATGYATKGSGPSDWSAWNVTSDWDGAPWSCLRLRIQCE